jgi:N-dimethylarginine dimethylaminohydrolase
MTCATKLLVDEELYHLDTCLAMIDERTCLWVPAAFSPRSRELVEAAFARRIEADEGEARRRLACNAWSPDGRRVLLPGGCPRTRLGLEVAGLEVREVGTDEFLKAGGSVFCMKLAHWGLAGAVPTGAERQASRPLDPRP